MNKGERSSFGNCSLRDKWEKRAQNIADQNKQEQEWQKKSSISVTVSKWTYHHALINKSGPSEFRKATTRQEEDDEKKPKIRFKVVAPPPPRPKTPPPATVPVAHSRDATKPKHIKRKVEVDVFKICWKDSWMSLKPPKYLFLRAMELRERLGFVLIHVFTNRTYKAPVPLKELRAPLTDGWCHSWKKVDSNSML